MAHVLASSATARGLSLSQRLRGWLDLDRQRHRLASLDEARLRDIGLTRGQAMTEAARPFWDAPDNWRK